MFKTEHFCSKLNCRDKHPKTCRYWKRGDCRRGQSCAFSHDVIDNVTHVENLMDKNTFDKTYIEKTCVTCKSNVESDEYKCSCCIESICNKCINGMSIWAQENSEFCKFINFPFDKTYCSKCVNVKTTRISMKMFEEQSKKIIKLPFMHVPEEECQGGGIYRQEFTCEKCSDRFCSKCMLGNHKEFGRICMNCARH